MPDLPDQTTAEALAILRSGRPNAGPEAAALLERALVLGSGQAAAKLAYFAAAGLGQAPNWDRSLDLLQRAADLGWSAGADELRVLAGTRSDDPNELRARIDIGASTAARRVELIRAAPRIGVCEGFLFAEECAWLINAARERRAPAAVYAREREGAEQVSVRTNSVADFALLDMDVVFAVLRRRIANTIGLPLEHFELPTLLHYAPGQRFAPHCDFLDARFPGPAADLRERGQRVLTFLVYLNEDFEGGETDFPRLGYRFKGKTGDAIMFANVDARFQPDFNTRHAGLAPTSGEKWLLSQWVRDQIQR
jgi:prolyl 4-hydroxylase